MRLPMILVIDIGNTDTVLGVFDGPELKNHWRVSTFKEKTAGENGVFLREFFLAAGLKAPDFTDVAACSVVPEVNAAFKEAVKECTGRPMRFVGEDIPYPMPVITDNPSEVGADRITNAVAAYTMFRSPVIIVDFGTAITIDYITGEGEYAGGAIAPGIGVSVEALVARASKLPGVEIVRPEKVVGRNTVESMLSGIFYGFTGLVDGIIKRMIAEAGGEPKVIATGGYSGLLKGESEFIKETDELLTLKGLKILCEGTF